MAFIFEEFAYVENFLNLLDFSGYHHVIVRSWPHDKALDEINLNQTTFWIQAIGIPICFTNPESANFIGNAVGKSLKADLNSSS